MCTELRQHIKSDAKTDEQIADAHHGILCIYGCRTHLISDRLFQHGCFSLAKQTAPQRGIHGRLAQPALGVQSSLLVHVKAVGDILERCDVACADHGRLEHRSDSLALGHPIGTVKGLTQRDQHICVKRVCRAGHGLGIVAIVGLRPVDKQPRQAFKQTALADEILRTIDKGLDSGRILVAERDVTRAADIFGNLTAQPQRPGGNAGHSLVIGLERGIYLGEKAMEHAVRRGQEEVFDKFTLHAGVGQHQGRRACRPERVAQPAAALALGTVHENVQRVEQQRLFGRGVQTVDIFIRAGEACSVLVGIGIVQHGKAVHGHRTRSAEIQLDVSCKGGLKRDKLGQACGHVQSCDNIMVIRNGAVGAEQLAVHQINDACALAADHQTDKAHAALTAVKGGEHALIPPQRQTLVTVFGAGTAKRGVHRSAAIGSRVLGQGVVCGGILLVEQRLDLFIGIDAARAKAHQIVKEGLLQRGHERLVQQIRGFVFHGCGRCKRALTNLPEVVLIVHAVNFGALTAVRDALGHGRTRGNAADLPILASRCTQHTILAGKLCDHHAILHGAVVGVAIIDGVLMTERHHLDGDVIDAGLQIPRHVDLVHATVAVRRTGRAVHDQLTVDVKSVKIACSQACNNAREHQLTVRTAIVGQIQRVIKAVLSHRLLLQNTCVFLLTVRIKYRPCGLKLYLIHHSTPFGCIPMGSLYHVPGSVSRIHLGGRTGFGGASP